MRSKTRQTQRQLGKILFKPDISPAEHKEHMYGLRNICTRTHVQATLCIETTTSTTTTNIVKKQKRAKKKDERVEKNRVEGEFLFFALCINE